MTNVDKDIPQKLYIVHFYSNPIEEILDFEWFWAYNQTDAKNKFLKDERRANVKSIDIIDVYLVNEAVHKDELHFHQK